MFKIAILITALCTFVTQAAAQTVLTFNHDGDVKAYDLDMLEAFPQTEYVTSNAFIDGSHTFSGPLLRDLLAAAGVVDANTITLSAANDYSIKYPSSDADEYDVIVATQIDGERMSTRDKGPLWVMYPFSKFSDLDDPIYKGRIIWQLVEISVP